MNEKPFLIYRSSAGSGKTFRLALEYLKIALKSRDAYKSILGVTFTNKATEEMKSRITDVLRDLSDGKDHPMKAELLQTLKFSDENLQRRSREVLTEILHQYGRFAVVTIDSFFHQVIRSFAREMGVQGSFSISLDTRKVMQEVIDNLLAELGEDEKEQLREWLAMFASSNVEDSKSWDFRREITELAEEILKDSFKYHADQILALSGQHDFFDSFRKEIGERKSAFENKCKKIAKEGQRLVDAAGGVDYFKYKSTGPASIFSKVLDGDFTITARQQDGRGNPGAWITQNSTVKPGLVAMVEQEILPISDQLISTIEEGFEEYTSLVEINRYFFTFGIISEIHRQLQLYRDEHDVILIADLPDFLRQIIRDSDTPFIYEKYGTRFHHYLIDEFQDTSAFQWNNFKALVKNATDSGQLSMVVGDVKQSIYRWRGGDSDLLQNQIKNDIGDYATREHSMDQNWRSAQEIVEFNNDFFSNLGAQTSNYFKDIPVEMQPALDQALTTYNDASQIASSGHKGGHVRIEFIAKEEEIKWTGLSLEKTIETVEKLQREGYELRDIAILTRSQREGREVSDAFFAHKASDKADPNLKYDVVSSESLYLFSSHAVKFMISLIKWLAHEEDKIALSEWMYEYQKFIVRNNSSLESTFFKNRNEWRKIVPQEFVKQRQYLRTLSVYEMVENIIRIFKLNEVSSEFTYLQGFQDAVLDFTKNERGDISNFLSWWEEVRKEKAILIADENNAIKVLTIHKAKGLEYPIVILPFLSWKIDHETYARNEIIWKKPPDLPLFENLPAVPLKYQKELKNTYWATEYWEERIRAFMDNLNLLYVAFTRAIHGLYAFGEMPKRTSYSNIGHFVLQTVSSRPGWDDAKGIFERGALPTPTDQKSDSIEYALKTYYSESWRDKVSIQMKGSEELSERVFQAQRWGIEFHRKLGKLKRLEDLPHLGDNHLKRELKMIVHHESIEPFFSEIEEVRVEEPILLPGGEFRRIDRLVKKNGKWHVIDFKTGSPRERDRVQVKGYIDILKEMGYTDLQGHLIYLDPILVEDVSG